jgi:DNA invertase Pin-like site-specific DNA recombinase
MVLDDTLTLRDEGLSAYHQRHITNGALGVFLRAVEDGHVQHGSVLIVEGLDRLSRAEPIQAQAQLAQIVNAGITVVTASDGREYNRDRLRAQPMDLVYSLLVMIRAHEESDTKSKRVKAAIRRQCQGWIAGHWRRPIRVGRDPQWVREVDGRFELIPERADAVRFLIEKYLGGYGSERTLRELEKLGVPISDAGKTCGPHLYKLFANRGLIGEKVVELDGEEYRLEGYYPPVVSPEKFAEVRYVAEQRKGRKGKGRPGQGEIPGIVTGIGIAYCGYCGTTVLAQNLMGRNRDDQGRPQRGHRRLVCHAYRQMNGCPVRGSISSFPVERALMHYCSDQINLSRLLEGDSGAAALSAQIAKVKMRVVEAEAKIGRATDALLQDGAGAPAALLKRLRELEEQLDRDKNEIGVLEHKLAAESAAPPAAAQAWADLVKGVEDLDYDARIKARQLVSDTFSRIVIYNKGFNPHADDKTIGVLLIAKRGTTRMIHVDRKTGEWRAAEEFEIPASGDIPLPSLRMVS